MRLRVRLYREVRRKIVIIWSKSSELRAKLDQGLHLNRAEFVDRFVVVLSNMVGMNDASRCKKIDIGPA